MVRLKHRWICLQLVAAQSLSSMSEAEIVEAIEDSASLFWGQMGLAQVRHHSAACYWYPATGVCVFKCAADMVSVVHVSMVLMNHVGHIAVRPRVIHVAATLVQARKFLIKHFHEWVAQERTGHKGPSDSRKRNNRTLDQVGAIEKHEKQMTRIT